jgi:hypothetical protein
LSKTVSDAAQVFDGGGVEPVGMGHDPTGDLADGRRFRAGGEPELA